LRAGGLRHRVTIQAPAVTRDEYGAAVTTWTDFATGVYASIEQMKAFDKAAVAATWPGADYTINLRYLPGVTGNMRVVDQDGVIYSILGRPNDVDGRHRELILTCESGVKAQ
jgi:SPP1 family predicted phage head-tail adaptor